MIGLAALLVACAPGEIPGPGDPLVALGEQLFFEPAISADGTLSCATCHDPALAFTDGRPVSIGVTGELLPRNAPSLWNVGRLAPLNWAHPGVFELELQAFVPLYGDDPPELGATPDALIAAVSRDLHRAAFGEVAITAEHARLALAAYQRSLVSLEAPYDAWLRGELELTAPAERGRVTFEASCAECHEGPLFTVADRALGPRDVFRWNGLPIGADRGLFEHTGEDADLGLFRVPSLRNVASTGPYMHDGQLATLDEVLAHYEGFLGLEPAGRGDLLAFLASLSDPAAAEGAAEAGGSADPGAIRSMNGG